MSNFNLEQAYNQKLTNLTLSLPNTSNINFLIKFSILIDILVTKGGFILKSDLNNILQEELKKNTKNISLQYEVEDEKNEILGILKVDIIDKLIGSFAGKIDINSNFKSLKNSSNQNYFIPINSNSQELKNLNFNNLKDTISPLDNLLNENLIKRIFLLNNLKKITTNLNNFSNNNNKINTNQQENVFNNNNFRKEEKFNSNVNFQNKINTINVNFYNHKMENNNDMNNNNINIPQNIIRGDNSNIKMRPEEIPMEDQEGNNLNINKNKFYERAKNEDKKNEFSQNKGPNYNNNLKSPDEIYEQELNKFTNPNQQFGGIGGNPKFAVPKDKRIPKQDFWDPNDPNAEVFNPNYQINPNRYIDPNFNEGNFFIGGNNPFFSSEGGMIPGGELIGPQSDIFSQEHPYMQKKPGAKIRYDPIGPFGMHGGPDKGNNKHGGHMEG